MDRTPSGIYQSNQCDAGKLQFKSQEKFVFCQKSGKNEILAIGREKSCVSWADTS